jgi:hypothetical protein
MSCCGQRAGALRASIAAPSSRTSQTGTSTVLRRAPEADAPREPVLEYIGATSLSVTGAVTGRTYRFEKPGAHVSVSRHDAWGLLQAPVLRLVGSRQSRPRT